MTKDEFVWISTKHLLVICWCSESVAVPYQHDNHGMLHVGGASQAIHIHADLLALQYEFAM